MPIGPMGSAVGSRDSLARCLLILSTTLGSLFHWPPGPPSLPPGASSPQVPALGCSVFAHPYPRHLGLPCPALGPLLLRNPGWGLQPRLCSQLTPLSTFLQQRGAPSDPLPWAPATTGHLGPDTGRIVPKILFWRQNESWSPTKLP